MLPTTRMAARARHPGSPRSVSARGSRRQARPAAELERGPARRAGQDRRARPRCGQLGERRLELQPRERRADAEVDPAAEREMCPHRSADVEPVRLGNRRGSRFAAPITSATLDPARGHAADSDALVEHPALEPLERRVVAEDLLDRVAERGLAGAERRHSSGWAASAATPFAVALTVASWPAISRTIAVDATWSSVSRSPSTVASSSADSRSSPVDRRRAITSSR